MAEGTLSAGTISLGVKPDTKGFGAKLKAGITGQVKGTGEHIGGMIKDGLKMMAGPIAAVAGTMGVEKIVENSVHAFEDLAGSVRQIQRVSGGTVEEVSGLRGAMQLAGVDTQKASGIMMIFAKNLGKAGTDAAKTAEMNKLFGQSIKDANGQIKPMAELLPGLADKFKAMPDGASKTALAMQLFGRQGSAILPFLNKGADGIKELTAKSKELGLTLDQNSINSFAKAKAEQREFDAAMQGLQVTLGRALLPVMEGFVNLIRQKVLPVVQAAVQWVNHNKGAFQKWGDTIKGILQPILNTLVGIIKNVVGWVVQNKDTLLTLTAAIGGAVAAFKLYQVAIIIANGAQKAWAFMQGIVKVATGQATFAQLGFNSALLANPIALIIIAVAGLVAGLVFFFTKTKLGQELWKKFTAFLGDTIKNIGKWFGGLWKSISDGWNAMVKVVQGVFTFIGNLFKGAVNGYISIWEGMINFVINGINGMLKIVNGALGTIGKAIGLNVQIGLIPNVKIPRLAEGGIVPATPGGRLVHVAEAGQAEAVIPLSKMQAMMANQGGGRERPIHADGIGLIGVLRETARGEAKLVFNHELSKVMRGAR
jgi:hypothetical protein